MSKNRRSTYAVVKSQAQDDARYRATFERIAVGIAHTAPDGALVDVNPALCEMLGYSRRVLLQRRLRDLLNDPSPGSLAGSRAEHDNDEKLIAGETGPYCCTERYRHRSGALVWVRRTVSVAGADTTSPYLLHFIEDVTAATRADHERRAAEVRYQRTLQSALECIVTTDHAGRIVEFNPMAEKVFGYSRQEVLGRSLADVLVPPRLRRRHERMMRLLSGDQQSMLNRRIETIALKSDGSTIPVELTMQRITDTDPPLFTGFLRELTERKRAQQQHLEAQRRLSFLAHYDQLTSLPNRGLFYDRLAQGITHAARNAWTLGVLFIDLDRFKHINDTMGHTTGDSVLHQVAARLLECVRAEDSVARLGSDAFAVVLAQIARPADAGVVAAKIMTRLKHPFKAGGVEVVLSASIGIALYPDDGDNPDPLMANADVAMYSAKSRGRDNFQFYTAEMNARALAKVQLESRLRGALERDEFVLHYQPKVSIESGHICGFEALLRWQPRGAALVPPAEFIPLLEETGLITPVGEWVIRAACRQIVAWRESGCEPVPIAINVSPRQLWHGRLCEAVASALDEHAVPAHLLEVEITESSIMDNPDEAEKALGELKAIGVSLAIDDFGTGYSSLAYLKRFPFDTLKIDRSFVRDVETDPDNATIARTIIALGGHLSLTVVAEGVETEEQLGFLAANRCDQAQGFLFCTPVAAESATDLLRGSAPLHRPLRRETRIQAAAVLVLGPQRDRLIRVQQLLQRDGYQVLTASRMGDALDVLVTHEIAVAIADEAGAAAPAAEFLRRVKTVQPRATRIVLRGASDAAPEGEDSAEGTAHRVFISDRDEERLRNEVRRIVRRSDGPPGDPRKKRARKAASRLKGRRGRAV